MSSSIAIPKRKNKQLERTSVTDSLSSSSASSPSSFLDQRPSYGSFEPKSPQSATKNRRPSLMCMFLLARLFVEATSVPPSYRYADKQIRRDGVVTRANSS